MDENKNCNCQCQQGGFGKGTYRILFIVIVFLATVSFFAVDDIKHELQNKERRKQQKKILIEQNKEQEKVRERQEGAEFFKKISEEFEKDTKRMENEEKINWGKNKYSQLKPNEKYKNMTKGDIKKMLQRLGYGD